MPVQAEIMDAIIRRPSQTVTRSTVQNFFHSSTAEGMAGVPLEDVFTMLDRARQSRETLVGFTDADLRLSYRAFILAIVGELGRRLGAFDETIYAPFFDQIAGRGADASSIVTLNWDTIPDFMIARRGMAIDYACEAIDLDGASGATGPPLRMLKMHGSVHWGLCTSCGRLFSIRDDESPAVLPHDRFCTECRTTTLEHLIITPTLLKDLSSVHLKNVWQRALAELQAAERIVFVGYSFPLADFEFRYLLLRSLIANPGADIRVVLFPPDRLLDERKRVQREDTESRYRGFFGARDLEIDFEGAVAFMNDPVRIWDW